VRCAEDVTFGGSGLDRADDLRGQSATLAEALETGRARAAVLWRGKPLVAGERSDELAFLSCDHPVLLRYKVPPVLIGRDDLGAPLFAFDISAWVPPGLDPEQLDSFLDAFEAETGGPPASIRDWVATAYDPDRLQADFDAWLKGPRRAPRPYRPS